MDEKIVGSLIRLFSKILGYSEPVLFLVRVSDIADLDQERFNKLIFATYGGELRGGQYEIGS